MPEYHYKYVGSLKDAEKFLAYANQIGYAGRIHKVRDDLYEVRTYRPEP